MAYTSLEQRAAQGYLDLFPQFIPDSQAPVSVSEQKVFYNLMERFYRLGMCPYYPGYQFWWPGVDDVLADNVIGLLGFMDGFAKRTV